jgi:hypothetical protein
VEGSGRGLILRSEDLDVTTSSWVERYQTVRCCISEDHRFEDLKSRTVRDLFSEFAWGAEEYHETSDSLMAGHRGESKTRDLRNLNQGCQLLEVGTAIRIDFAFTWLSVRFLARLRAVQTEISRGFNYFINAAVGYFLK